MSFKPTLILHGGAGNIRRSTLPPSLYQKYHASLTSYLRSTHEKLQDGSSALDAAVHAVSLMEDDELFNCGRGSVFTSAGTIEMEASVMVTSVNPDNGPNSGSGPIKRGMGVIGLKNVRNPIKLAKEALLRTGVDREGNPVDDSGKMHSQLVGPHIEALAKEWGLEFEKDEYFWTKRRWDEHRRGLGGTGQELFHETLPEIPVSMSQGTVGAVCLDRDGSLAVATSTGGMTNKWPGRVGDTPTLGAGFWAEDWEALPSLGGIQGRNGWSNGDGHGDDGGFVKLVRELIGDCLPPFFRSGDHYHSYAPVNSGNSLAEKRKRKRRAVAVSGTGNGDSFLRICAARTACGMMRFAGPGVERSLAETVSAVVGPGGELQRSAGKRWGKTGEGEGGMIGIEAETSPGSVHGEKRLGRGWPVFDYNCSGMWRAYIEDGPDGEKERVMVFREEYH